MIKQLLNSFLGQFVIGGTTVSGISYLSNNVNPLLGGIFGGIPIGLPSAIFVDNNKVLRYLQNLSIMTVILSCVTILAYVLKLYNYTTQYTIGVSMFLWFVIAFIYYIFKHNYKYL